MSPSVILWLASIVAGLVCFAYGAFVMGEGTLQKSLTAHIFFNLLGFGVIAIVVLLFLNSGWLVGVAGLISFYLAAVLGSRIMVRSMRR